MKEIYILEAGKDVVRDPRRDDKVEEISMQILTGKERRNRSFQRNLFSRVETWKKTMGPCQAIQLLVGNGFCSSRAHFLFRIQNISETIFRK